MRTWKPMSLTRENLDTRVDRWMTKPVETRDITDQQTDIEQRGVSEVAQSGHVNWSPELGRRMECDSFIAGIHDDMSPCNIHLFFKAHTAAVRCINVLADQAVADVILGVLEQRYPANSYKIEFYGSNPVFKIDLLDMAGLVSENCMCVVLKEGPFNATPKFRDETVKKIDEALRELPS